MRADGEFAKRRPADDQLAAGELQQIGEVRCAVRELLGGHELAEAIDVRPQVASQPVPVELVARPDRAVLRRILRSHEPVASVLADWAPPACQAAVSSLTADRVIGRQADGAQRYRGRATRLLVISGGSLASYRILG